jgi:glycosyltransferase involved in cell wall biosynthesis
MNISVIIPVYNAEKYILKAVSSALEIEDVKEVILVEDGSPDKVLDICISLSKQYEIVKLFRHPNGENRGAGESRNLGIKNATQDFIAFLDADDFYLSNRFIKDKEVFHKNRDADGVYNALGIYYYSKKGREDFKKKMRLSPNNDNYLTTVNHEVEPKPSDCFEGFLGLIPKFGYFSLDGLTLKTSSLKKMDKLFWKSSMHEDSEFIVRLAYYCKLFPGELKKATVLRGVHDENRITESSNALQNRLLQFSELYNWYRKCSGEKRIESFLFFMTNFFHFKLNNSNPTLASCLFFTLKYPSIFFNDIQFLIFLHLYKPHSRLINLIARLRFKIILLFFKKNSKRYNFDYKFNLNWV